MHIIGLSALWLVLSLAIYGVYYLPGWIAVSRGHPQALPLVVINLGLGWTVIGWIGALAWSLMSVREGVTRSVSGARLALFMVLVLQLVAWALLTFGLALEPLDRAR